jgi:hypothetical protein
MATSSGGPGPPKHRRLLATNLSVAIPPNLEKHQLLAFRSQDYKDAPIQYLSVPEGTEAYGSAIERTSALYDPFPVPDSTARPRKLSARRGDRMRLRSMIYFEGLGEPSVYDLHVVTMPQVKTLDALLHGFDGPLIACVHFPTTWPCQLPADLCRCSCASVDPARSSRTFPSSSSAFRHPILGMISTAQRCDIRSGKLSRRVANHSLAHSHTTREAQATRNSCALTRAMSQQPPCSRASSAQLHGCTAAQTCPCASPGHTSLTPSASHVTLSDSNASRLLQPDEQQRRPWTGTSEETGDPHPPPRSPQDSWCK